MKIEEPATAIDASVGPSRWLVAYFLKVVPGSITVASPSSLKK